jgi:hypothetical protein
MPTVVTNASFRVRVTDSTSPTNQVAEKDFTVTINPVAPTRIIGLSGNLAFGSVPVGATGQRMLTIPNTGNALLTVTGIAYPSGFSGAWSGTIAAGGAQNVTVTFAPTAVASYAGTVTVSSDATGGTNATAASGTGVPVPTALTNAIASVGGMYIALSGATNAFTASGVDASENPVSCTWDFGDGSTSTDCSPSHVYTNCQSYTVTRNATNSFTANATNLTVLVPCVMPVTSLQMKVSFAELGADSCKLKALPQPSQCTNWLGTAVSLDVGGAQVSWTLDKKGRGVSTNGTCRFAYNKKTKVCTFTGSLTRGTWQTPRGAHGLVDATIAKPGNAVTLPVILLIGDEAFMAEKPLRYTAKAGKSGIAK